ncbi:MAG: hypothetical protein ACETWC_03560 [Acidobacteriota bacterium]
MRKIYPILALFIMPLFALLIKADQVDVTGDWELTVKSPRGEMTSDIRFVQEGENLTVTMEDRQGNEITGQGTVTDNEIKWTIIRSTPRGEMTVTYTGKIEGDTMSGEAQMGERGSFEWSATRKVE